MTRPGVSVARVSWRGGEVADVVGTWIHAEPETVGAEDVLRWEAEAFEEQGGSVGRGGGAGGKIQFEFVEVASHDGERAGERIEDEAFTGLAEFAEDDVGGGEGGVAAEVDLDGRGEPAEVEAIGGGANEEGGFGEAVFEGDALEERVVEPGVERDDGGGIAGEDAIGEGVDPIKRKLHGVESSTVRRVRKSQC